MTLNTENTCPVIQFRKYVLTQIFEIVVVSRKPMAKGPCKVSFMKLSSISPVVGGGNALFCIQAPETHIVTHMHTYTLYTTHTYNTLTQDTI